MPPATLTQLKDKLVDLYGEDMIALFATMVARRHVDELIEGGLTTTTNRLSFGQDDPNDPSATEHYNITFGELLDRTDPACHVAKAARARLIVFAYTLWEHVYRPAISQECGLQRVDNDAFGDLRHYRNAILHNKGILEHDTKALTVFGKGDAIEPTNDELHNVFKQLVLALNDVGLRYYGEDPGFEWERRLNA